MKTTTRLLTLHSPKDSVRGHLKVRNRHSEKVPRNLTWPRSTETVLAKDCVSLAEKWSETQTRIQWFVPKKLAKIMDLMDVLPELLGPISNTLRAWLPCSLIFLRFYFCVVVKFFVIPMDPASGIQYKISPSTLGHYYHLSCDRFLSWRTKALDCVRWCYREVCKTVCLTDYSQDTAWNCFSYETSVTIELAFRTTGTFEGRDFRLDLPSRAGVHLGTKMYTTIFCHFVL